MRSSKSVEKNILTLKGFIETPGDIPVLLTAPHAMGPRADLLTGEIAYRIATEVGAYALIATVSREDKDYNRAKWRNTPFRKRIQEIISGLLKTHSEVLLLDIHGMEKPITSFEEITVLFGTSGGVTINVDYIEMLSEELEARGIQGEYAFMEGPQYMGGDIISYHGKISKGVHAVQLEIAAKNRKLGERDLIDAIVNFIRRWDLTKLYKHELKKTAMRRLLKDAGAKRIGQDAPGVLRDILESIIIQTVVRAANIASTSQRKTIEGKDIRKGASGLLKKKR